MFKEKCKYVCKYIGNINIIYYTLIGESIVFSASHTAVGHDEVISFGHLRSITLSLVTCKKVWKVFNSVSRAPRSSHNSSKYK